VPAGKTVEHDVVEEQNTNWPKELLSAEDKELEEVAATAGVSPAVREALTRVVRDRKAASQTEQELAELRRRQTALKEEQDRLRLHLEKLPANSAPQKRALEKFDKADVQLDKVREQIEAKLEAARKQQQQLEGYARGLNLK
jgi:hypothetical protein